MAWHDIKVGDRFGYLEVIRRGVDNNKHKVYTCVCHKCGALDTVRADTLAKGKTECRACRMMKTDYTGRIIGDFKVLGKSGAQTQHGYPMYICECINCGLRRTFSTNDFALSRKSELHCLCRKHNMDEDKPGILGYINMYNQTKTSA